MIIDIENSKTNRLFLEIFLKLGIIKGFSFINKYTIEVALKYNNSICVFKKIKLVSKPSKPVYVTLVDLERLKSKTKTSFYIISTNKGLFFDFECIYKKLSGKVILKIEL